MDLRDGSRGQASVLHSSPEVRGVVIGVLDGSMKPLRMIGSPAIRGHRLKLWIIEPRTMIDSCRHQIDCPNYASGLNELSLRLKRAPSGLLRTDPLRPFDRAQGPAQACFDRAQHRPFDETQDMLRRNSGHAST